MTLPLDNPSMSDTGTTYSYHRQPGPDFGAEIARSYRFEWLKLPGSLLPSLLVLRLDGSEVARLVPESGVNVETLAWRWAEADAMRNGPLELPPIQGSLVRAS